MGPTPASSNSFSIRCSIVSLLMLFIARVGKGGWGILTQDSIVQNIYKQTLTCLKTISSCLSDRTASNW